MATFAPDHSNIAAWPEPQPDCSHDLDLAGESLEAVIQAEPIVLSRLLDIAVRAAEDLSICHAAGSVHGRLTAGSIMLDRNGGIKLLFQDSFPEGSPQDDQLALGQVLLAALPATAANPDSFRLVIDRLLALDPHDRYSSTRDLYLDLRAIRGRVVPGTPEPRPAPATVQMQQPVRNRRPFLAVPATFLAFSVFAFYLLNHSALPKRGQAEIQSFPVWSADGERILFVKSVAGIDQIFVHKRASTAPVQLTHAARPSLNPRWSSDGKSIEFQTSGKWASVRLP
jgi:hypothetical protein